MLRKNFNICMIIMILLLVIIAVPVSAQSKYIAVVGVVSGENTNSLNPVEYLVDGEKNTAWGFKNGSKQGWAEISLEKVSIIQAVQLSANINSGIELYIEYRKNKQWLPFMAPSLRNLYGNKLVDLSYDQIVTNKLRLRLKGSNLGQCILKEIKILGEPAEEYYHRIKPTEITATENTDPVYPAEFLNDGNTYTLWKTEKEIKDWQDKKFDEVLEELTGRKTIQGNNKKGSNQGNGNNQQEVAEVEFDLGEIYKLENIKLYLSDHLKGDIEVHTYQNGEWQYLDNITGQGKGHSGWFRIDLNGCNVVTGQVKIVLTGYGGELGGLGEVEFWGTGSYQGENSILLGIQEPRSLQEMVHSQFELSDEEIKEYTLELAVKDNTQQKLNIELNGNIMALEPFFNLRGYTIYKKKIAKDIFWKGKNFLKVHPASGLTLLNSRLSNKVRANTDPQLGDGRLFEPVRDLEEIEISLEDEGQLLPAFPTFSSPPNLPDSGSRKIEDWNRPVVIARDVSYDTLTVNTELQIDTSYNDVYLVVKDLQMGSNGSITIIGNGKVYLYVENDLSIKNGSRVNGTGKDKSLKLFHNGSRIEIQGGIGGEDKYKFAGNIYTKAADIFIQNGANFKGSLYAESGNIIIRGGITASELIYARSGNVTITGGANVRGKIISGGDKIEIYGGSTFDGSGGGGGITASDAEIYIDQGAVIKGEINANSEKVHIGNINHKESFYKVPEIRNFENEYIEEITVYSLEDKPLVKVYAQVDNNWLEINQTAEGLKSITFREYLKTNQLLVKNEQGLPITEVVIKYSSENNREPGIEILRPEDNQQFTHQELAKEKVIGYVDNPDTEVIINGQQAYHRGHFFWLEANRTGAGSNKANYITAVAKDKIGRVNYDSKTIYVGNHSLLDVNLADEILYTQENTLSLSGTIRNPLNQLNINNEPVNITGKNFNKVIELNAGLNLIKIEGSKLDWQGKKDFSRTIYRKVVRLTPITLSVDSPLDGYYTNKDSIIVSGMAAGYGDITVRVNEQEVFLDGSKFISQEELQEGRNIIKIEAVRGSEKVVKEITVIRDTIVPRLGVIFPDDAYISNKSTVHITGEVLDSIPVLVYVNNKPSHVNGLSFDNQLTFIDGFHDIIVKMVDLAGNQSKYEFSITVDTNPPADFQVFADPADWTNNTQPVLTFETVDETSGISHYELAVDGDLFKEVGSPYKLPVLSDGEHEIIIKAVDNAGWETTAETRVYIDTTPPTVPDYFKAVPGDERVLIRWQESVDSDVVRYRIKRRPEWADSNDRYVSAEKTIIGEDDYNFEYIDSEVEKDQEYTYYIQSVDRAENLSKSRQSSVQVGIVEEPVTPETGGEGVFDGIEVKIPQGAVDEKAILQIKTAEAVPGFENNVTSRTFSIELLDEEGNIKETELIKDAQITMNYDQELIPEGYSPFDLNIYYYDEAEERWLKFEREKINLVRNKLTINTDHFSLYSVQVTDNYSPAKEDYEDLGIAPYQSYFKNNQEYISAASGSLTIHSTDFNLPGRNGLDLQIARIFDVKTIMMEKSKIAMDEDDRAKGYTSFGGVWNINLPWIEKTDTGTFVHFEDGSAYKAELEKKGGKISAYYHEGKHFYIEKNNNKYIVITKNGKQYLFNADQRITEIIDRTGQNKITFYYSGSRVNYIIDSIGRRIDFTYSGNRIERITVGQQNYTYNYRGDSLHKVIDPEGRETEYIYSTKKYRHGVTGDLDDLKYYDLSIPVIEKINYPTGAESRYKYSEHQVLEDDSQYGYEWTTHNSTIVVDDHYQLADGRKYNQVSYQYSFTDKVDDYRVTETEVLDAEKKSIMKYNRDRQHISKTVYSRESGEKLEQYKYGYNPHVKAIFLKEIYKPEDGRFVYTYGNYYEYDNWGNVIRSENTGSRLVTKQYYLNTDSSPEEFRDAPFTQTGVNSNIHNLPAGKMVYNYSSLTGETAKYESAYQYDEQGNMIGSADYQAEENEWLTKELKYDRYGNISMIIDTEGHVTENEYDDKYGSAYLTMVKKYRAEGSVYLEDADGKQIPAVVQRYGYDKNTGLKTWEISPVGDVTRYRYDRLNRLTRIIYPDEDDEEKISGNLAQMSIDSIESMMDGFDFSDNPVKIQYYDDENNVTTVLNTEGDIELTEGEINAQYITGKIFNKSRYEYNGLNKLLSLKQYLSQQELDEYYESRASYPFTTMFEYDTMGRKILTIDAEGKKTRKVYDELGQVIEIIYNEGSISETSTSIEYYPAENKRIITDPEGNRTIEDKDWAGNVVEVSKLFKDGTEYSSYAEYDSLGNKLQVVDGKGRTTDFYYDSLNRLIEKKLPAGEYVLSGNENPTPDYRPALSYSYDKNGNKISETDANGNTTGYIYDGVNRLIKIVDARGKVSRKYYDSAGREIRVVDPLGNTRETAYDSRGNKIAEIDGEGNAAYIEYDIIGNKIAEYDPRGVIPVDDNPDGCSGEIVELNDKEYILLDKYKTIYQYDSLARKVRTTYPVVDGEKTAYDEIIHYDSVGNKTKVINGEKEVNYLYYDTYWLKAEQVVTDDGIRTTGYGYDKVGNKRYVTEAEGNPDNITGFNNDNYPFVNNDYTTEYVYDDLYRLKEEIRSDGSRTEFHYDEVGNKILEKDAEGNITEYRYNPYDKLTEVYEAGIERPTEYQYDPGGNMVKKTMSNNLETSYKYNNLNQLIKETKPGNEITTYSYDDAGNLAAEIIPRGIREEYSYYRNGLVDKIDYYSSPNDTTPAETINYQYDRTGNRTLVEKEESSIAQSYDSLGRITAESRTIADKTYTTKYRYDKYGNLTGIKYPESDDYLSYGYDELNQLKWIEGIAGDKDNTAFEYNRNGQLTEMLYDNGVETRYGYNELGRPESIVTNRTNLENNTEEILNLNYQYDRTGNVTVRNNNNYDYDDLNRLTKAEVEGDFYLENQGTNGRALEDYFGEESLTFAPEEWEYECDFGKQVAFDFNSGSIGVAFEQEVRNITRLELKTLGIADHRADKRTLEVFYSDNNVEYTKLADDEWKYERDYKGDITLTILKNITARYIKVHNKFVDWNGDFEVIDEGQFINGLEHMIKVYSRDDGATINYEYDSAGNRTKKVLRTLSGNMKEYEYHYYSGTNRLKDYTINGKNAYAYVYDKAGNLVKKGNKYNIEGNSVTFIETEGQGVEYFEYEYNLQNRLSGVKKNGEIIAEFQYDADGMRIKAEEQLEEDEDNRTTYYVYGFSGKVLMEESSGAGDTSEGSSDDTETTVTYTSYIYVFSKTFAKVEGIIDTAALSTAKLSYFHYDNLGSTRVMTNSAGKIVFDQDYLPFGGDLPGIGQVEVQNDTGERYKYTGQKQVVSIGLYYYGARYYDPEIGRFITEDTYFGQLVLPQSQNLYVYVMNNPMRYIDPSGNYWEEIGDFFTGVKDWASQIDVKTTFGGAVRMIGGTGQILAGLPLFVAPEPVTTAGGVGIILWGADNFIAGGRTFLQGLRGEGPVQALAEQGLVNAGGIIGESINGEKGRAIGENIGQIAYITGDLAISIYGTKTSIKSIRGHMNEQTKMMNMAEGNTSPNLNFAVEGSDIVVQPYSSAYSPSEFLSTNQLITNSVMIGNDIFSYPGSIDNLFDSFGEFYSEPDMNFGEYDYDFDMDFVEYDYDFDMNFGVYDYDFDMDFGEYDYDFDI